MRDMKILNNNGQLLVDSRDVAEMIDKNHSHLLRDIEGYKNVIDQNPKLDSDQFFIESSYNAGTGKSYKCYQLTKKGCDMVANKLTGEKGVLFTATYVTKFEEMENHIKSLSIPSYTIEDPIERAERWIEEQKQNRMLEQRVKEYEPKVTYYDVILQSSDVVNITQIAKDYGLSGAKLNDILHAEGIQYKLSGQWLLYGKHQDKGYTKSHTTEYKKSTDEIGIRMHTKWTQKGRLFIHQVLDKRGILPVMDRKSEAS
jgi:Rha family phage regulatory protein